MPAALDFAAFQRCMVSFVFRYEDSVRVLLFLRLVIIYRLVLCNVDWIG